MEQERALRCQCGRMRGTAKISPQSGVHIVCYCEDCRAFAHHLKRPDVLDHAGGTSIFQMAPARLTITQGADVLRCLRLTPKGMVRWYTECCRTPVGNTVAGRLPFVGLITCLIDFASDGVQRDAVLGTPTLLVTQSATSDIPNRPRSKAPLGFLLRIAGHLATWWITGRGQPSPFVDTRYEPRVTPYVLTPEERAALRPSGTDFTSSTVS